MSPPIGFLRAQSRREGPLSTRKAVEDDLPAIEALVRQSPRAYSGLGGAVGEAIRDDVVLTAWQRGALAGFVMAHQQGPVCAWLHAFGLAADVSTSAVGEALLRATEQQLARQGVSWIGYMDEYGLSWLYRLLEEAGFQQHTRVVAYETPLLDPPDLGNRLVWIRPARRPDIPAISRVDQVAFIPLWAYREEVFHALLGHVACFFVAEEEGQIVGYVLSTHHPGNHAHIVRLAVHPAKQGQGIGGRLLAEAFTFFQSLGVKQISLNTQEENDRSQRLYRRFGFRATGGGIKVWAKEIPLPRSTAAGTAPQPGRSVSPPQ